MPRKSKKKVGARGKSEVVEGEGDGDGEGEGEGGEGEAEVAVASGVEVNVNGDGLSRRQATVEEIEDEE